VGEKESVLFPQQAKKVFQQKIYSYPGKMGTGENYERGINFELGDTGSHGSILKNGARQ